MSFLSRYFMWKITGLFILAAVVMVSIASFTPKNFPVGGELHVPQKISLSDVSVLLAKQHIITSPFLFKVTVAVFHGQKGIVAGDYIFSKQENLLSVADRLARGDQQLVPVKITIPEGVTVPDVALIFLKKMPHFNAPYFMKIAHSYEGYLFPDTYLFYPNESTQDVFEKIRANFDAKMKTMTLDIQLSHRTQADLVIMASLLEKEASSTNDRIIISGILWKKLDAGLPLQVDVPLVYITGRNVVSLDDTKIDSPYNTYKYKGLPKGPIGNPGLDALMAAAHPVQSTYFFYLSDPEGKMHYARTYDEHLANKKKYMK